MARMRCLALSPWRPVLLEKRRIVLMPGMNPRGWSYGGAD